MTERIKKLVTCGIKTKKLVAKKAYIEQLFSENGKINNLQVDTLNVLNINTVTNDAPTVKYCARGSGPTNITGDPFARSVFIPNELVQKYNINLRNVKAGYIAFSNVLKKKPNTKHVNQYLHEFTSTSLKNDTNKPIAAILLNFLVHLRGTNSSGEDLMIGINRTFTPSQYNNILETSYSNEHQSKNVIFINVSDEGLCSTQPIKLSSFQKEYIRNAIFNEITIPESVELVTYQENNFKFFENFNTMRETNDKIIQAWGINVFGQGTENANINNISAKDTVLHTNNVGCVIPDPCPGSVCGCTSV